MRLTVSPFFLTSGLHLVKIINTFSFLQNEKLTSCAVKSKLPHSEERVRVTLRDSHFGVVNRKDLAQLWLRAQGETLQVWVAFIYPYMCAYVVSFL